MRGTPRSPLVRRRFLSRPSPTRRLPSDFFGRRRPTALLSMTGRARPRPLFRRRFPFRHSPTRRPPSDFFGRRRPTAPLSMTGRARLWPLFHAAQCLPRENFSRPSFDAPLGAGPGLVYVWPLSPAPERLAGRRRFDIGSSCFRSFPLISRLSKSRRPPAASGLRWRSFDYARTPSPERSSGSRPNRPEFPTPVSRHV